MLSKFRSPRRHAEIAEDIFSQELLTVAQRIGVQKGLPTEEAQDCAIGFALHLLADERLRSRVRNGAVISAAWLHTCTLHWVYNFLRCRQRLLAHECALPEAEAQSHDAENIHFSPEARLLRVELQQRFLNATLRLSERQQELFARRVLDGQTCEEIAAATRRTTGAVRIGLWTLRRRMQTLLAAEGLTPDEINQYLYALSALASPAVRAKKSLPKEREP